MWQLVMMQTRVRVHMQWIIKKLLILCHEMDDTQESCSCAGWTFTLHFSFQHQLTDQPPGMWNIPDFVRYISGILLKYSSSSFWLNRIFQVYDKHMAILTTSSIYLTYSLYTTSTNFWGSSRYPICIEYIWHIPSSSKYTPYIWGNVMTPNIS